MIPSDPDPVSPHRVSHRPRIALTVGDVAGIGPELVLQCAALAEVQTACVPLVIGPMGVLRHIAKQLAFPLPDAIRPHELESAPPRELSGPRVIDVGELDPIAVRPGVFTAATGAASYAAVEFAIDAALAGHVDGIVTGPIQKEAWHAAGIPFPGHTELLAAKTGSGDARMMLTSDTISCALVTIHLPLADVAATLTTESIAGTIRMAAAAVHRRLGRPARITVCGLNPHAGEHGLFSHGEEESIIAPAIEQAQMEGLDVCGPLPPDTAFTPTQRNATDVYVCMYHDQGLIPLKALSFEDAVNVTLGLPIVRTSVDHGTALDLAWQGKADHRSMLAAIRLAVELSLPVS